MSDIPWKGKGFVPNSRTAKKLDGLKRIYEEVQRTRRRDAIFTYLDEVYREVRRMSGARRQKIATALHRLDQCTVREDTCLFSILVQLTTDADRRVRNKWIRALRKALKRGCRRTTSQKRWRMQEGSTPTMQARSAGQPHPGKRRLLGQRMARTNGEPLVWSECSVPVPESSRDGLCGSAPAA